MLEKDRTIKPKVTLPSNAPLTPSTCCELTKTKDSVTNTPHSKGQLSVVQCPTSIGGSCPRLTSRTPGRRLATLSVPSPGNLSTPGSGLVWDNFTESPIFSHALIQPNFQPISDVERPSVASSTDHNVLDDAKQKNVNGIDRLSNNKIAVRQAQIVSTDCSDLEEVVIMDASKVKQLKADHQRILDEIEDMNPDLFTAAFAPQMRTELDKIWEMKNNFRNNVRTLIQDLPDEDGNKVYWSSLSKTVVDKVIAHKAQVLTAIENLCPAQKMSPFELKSLELQEMVLKENQEVRKAQEDSAKKVAWAEAKVRLDAFRDYTTELVAEIDRDQTEVNERDNVTVAHNMQELQLWKKLFEKISINYREYVRIVKTYGEENPSAEELTTAEEEFNAVKENFDSIKDNLEKADRDRELFSTHKSTSEKLDYPRFSGASSEDFIKFKDKIMKAFRVNGVAKSEQIDRLRKQLSGFALALVPESTLSIDKAFETLKAAYGDPRKVLDDRMDKLKALGDLPPDRLAGDKPGFRKQEEWYLSIEALLSEIVELGLREEDLAYHAFSEQTFNFILSLFPSNLADKLAEVEGSRSAKLKGVLDKLIVFRTRSQRLGKIYGNKAPPGSESSRNTSTSNTKIKSSLIAQPGRFFKGNERYEDCRICKHMEKEGKSGVFENHISTYPTGCPIFAAMTTSQRRAVAIKCSFCVQCLDPDVYWDDGHKNCCKVSKSKLKDYSCQSNRCKVHMWLCVYHHKRFNKQQMEKHKDTLQKKGITLAFVSLVLNASGESPLQSAHGTAVQSIEEATRKLIRSERKQCSNEHIKVVPPPIGQPMFLFFQVKGKNKGANFFFDKGCSHACFQEGIPGGELRGEIVAKGPFDIGGVGDIKTKANDEWLVSVETTDGGRQLIQGLTVDKVTADFPLIDVEMAVAEVKRDKPKDKFLQSCQVPKKAGGVTHGLIGIKYELIHPDPIHTLPSGLTLYRSKLVGQDPGVNAMIGGPHSSFDFLCDHLGGAANMVANFVQGIQRYRSGQWNAPKLPNMPMTKEETEFAKKFASSGVLLDVVELEQAEVKAVRDISEVIELTSDALDDSSLDSTNLQCSNCSTFIDWEGLIHDYSSSPALSLTVGVDNIHQIKKNLQLLESGLDVEYRCVKCRECVQCKKSENTEKISIREEQEMQLIRESINLDWENKKVICTLPVRGEESDFLTTNRDRALKVLDQQCKRWHKDINKDAIIQAFNKLFKTGDTRFMDQLTQEELDCFINKPTQYFIPWRIVYNESTTTPIRPVLDGSSITRRRQDGKGGRCLNDFVVKGKIESLNIIRLILGFIVGQHAVTGDLSNFYYSFRLLPGQWNLQRFLWRHDLNPNNPVVEGIIGALIYGIKCVSCLTETAMEEIADSIQETNPNLATFIRKCRYVDDLSKSAVTLSELKAVVREADILFEKIGLQCKAWTYSSEPPPSVVKMENGAVKVAGLRWLSEIDTIEVPIPSLHFSKKQRGKLPDSAQVFSGSFADLDKFVPKNLSRRHVASKMASIFDLLGKFAPIQAGFKVDLRKVVKNTTGWDDSMEASLRNKWLDNFWKFEQLKGIKFSRARMPSDALDNKMRIITSVDAAQDILMVGIWAGFRRPGNTWSCQHLIGRALLAEEESTIPRNELQALCGGANLSWIVKKSLEDWIESSILVGDSEIALCWTTADNKPLSIFHRNRAVQIRRSVSMDELYHVKTEANPADIGTRPDKVTISDVGPGSKWEEGETWMLMDVDQAQNQGFIKPANSLRLNIEQEEDFKKGLTFEKVPELLTRGHAVTERRLGLLEQRAEFSKYLVLPTRYCFPKVVRILSIVFGFISKARRGRKMTGSLLTEGRLKFSVFSSNIVPHSVELDNSNYKGQYSALNSNGVYSTSNPKGLNSVVVSQSVNPVLETDQSNNLVNYFAHQSLNIVQRDIFLTTQSVRTAHNSQLVEVVCDKYINIALSYLYRKASLEVKQFCKNSLIDKITIEVEGVLLSKGRILDQMNFESTADLPNLDLGALNVKVHLPVIDRYSPLAYSVAEHVHWNMAKHKGIETCNRISLQNVSIVQGVSLFRELSDQCIRCKMKRKKFIEVAMGPISDRQLALAPPFWSMQVDLFGPIAVKVPGFERQTRNRRVLEADCHIMTAVCPTTRLVNLQVLESVKTAGWIDGFTRLCCEVGVPSFIFMDQDSAGMSAFTLADIEYRDLQLNLLREKGISFSVCAVAGHDKHGHVERIIQSIQTGLTDSGLKSKILHATGLQSLCKLIESQYNNLPLGFHYGRSADNTQLLKIITPNMLRIGRVNSRSLDGPIRLPESRMDLLSKVEETYCAWYKIWLDTLVPKLMFTPKWFQTDKELKTGDLVYFRKKDSVLDGKWVIGRIEKVERGRDNLIREAEIKYFNGKNETPQFTQRTVRKLVKLWDVDEMDLQEDLDELGRKFGLNSDLSKGNQNLNGNVLLHPLTVTTGSSESYLIEGGDVAFAGPLADNHSNTVIQEVAGLGALKSSSCGVCCCQAHHALSIHYKGSRHRTLPSDDWSWNLCGLADVDLEDQKKKPNCCEIEDLILAVNWSLDLC